MSNAANQARLRERRKAADPVAWSALCTATQAKFRARHPEKKAAWNAVYKALQNGRLVRPAACGHCSASCKPEASHTDYTKRLEVEWLCKPCHAAKDKRLRRN